ncbi:hypothetical protein AAU61_13750 [Desulfocarbo indianensis]|nr:hypothetical protein AAU61_13750 [Desulfocarbo indianensis]
MNGQGENINEAQALSHEEALLARVKQALRNLEDELGFPEADHLEASIGREDWDSAKKVAELWSRLNKLHDGGAREPETPKAWFLEAAGLLLADLASMVRDQEQAALWDLASLQTRLEYFYRQQCQPIQAQKSAAAKTQISKEALDEKRQRTAKRWRSELLPPALGWVFNAAGHNLTMQYCKELAEYQGHKVLIGARLNGEGKELVNKVMEALPEVDDALNNRFEQVFDEVNYERWEYLKPDQEEVILYIKARLHSRGMALSCGIAETTEDAEGSVAERFVTAFKALVADGMTRRMARNLNLLEEKLKNGDGSYLIRAVHELGSKAEGNYLNELLQVLAMAKPHESASAVDELNEELQKVFSEMVKDSGKSVEEVEELLDKSYQAGELEEKEVALAKGLLTKSQR